MRQAREVKGGDRLSERDAVSLQLPLGKRHPFFFGQKGWPAPQRRTFSSFTSTRVGPCSATEKTG